MDKTWIWAIFLEKLGGLVRGIGKLLIETGAQLRKVAQGQKIDLEQAKEKLQAPKAP